MYWNFATKLHQRTISNSSIHHTSLHSHYNWINDCNKKETSYWKWYRSTRSQKSGQFLPKFCFRWTCNLFLGFQLLSKGVRSIINNYYKKICDSFDLNCSFQNTWRKAVHLPSLAIGIHTDYYCTSDLVFCHFYKNLDEKRNQTIYLWQQHSPSK